MSVRFPIKVGQQVAVLPRGNARYLFRHGNSLEQTENTPLPAEITSVGRVYFNVIIENHTQTRFRKDDFTSADKEENSRYEIFPSIDAAADYVARHQYFREIKELLHKGLWNKDMFNHVTTQEIHTFLLRLKNEIQNEKEETE